MSNEHLSPFSHITITKIRRHITLSLPTNFLNWKNGESFKAQKEFF